MEVSEQTVLE